MHYATPNADVLKTLLKCKESTGTTWVRPEDRGWVYVGPPDGAKHAIGVCCHRCSSKLVQYTLEVSPAHYQSFLLLPYFLAMEGKHTHHWFYVYVGQCPSCHQMYWSMVVKESQPTPLACTFEARRRGWSKTDVHGLLMVLGEREHYQIGKASRELSDLIHRDASECRAVLHYAFAVLERVPPEKLHQAKQAWSTMES